VSMARPAQQLVGWARLGLEPGETARVGFVVLPEQLAFLDRTGRWVVEEGRVAFWVGRSAADLSDAVTVTVRHGGPVERRRFLGEAVITR
jgi:hypothetical protein